MQNYTCNSCGLAFPTPEDQRSHMKTDWHRYNLKRRVAQLPPIDEGTFNQKIAAVIKAEEVAREDDAPLSKKDLRRKQKEDLAEQKRQLLETARKQMSKLSIEELEARRQAKAGSAQPEEGTFETEETAEETAQTAEEELTEEQQAEKLMQEKLANRVEIPQNSCLFCTKTFPYLGVCLTHMLKQHGMYVPEPEYLTNVDGLIHYLAEKIGLGNVCLSCNFQGRSLESVRAHMLAKGHCKIPYHTEDEKLEVSEFYDFTKSYQKTNGEDDEESEWEDVSDEGESGEDEDGEELPQEIIYTNGYELHLPTGKVAGHRSLARYYRQTFRPERVLSEGQGTVVAAESRHFATVADRQQLQLQKRVWKREYKARDSYDRHAARTRNHQEHYRDQLLQ